MAKYVVGTVDQIPVGARKIVVVAGRSIGLFNIGGSFFALRNTCPHQGGPLCEGRLSGLLTASKPGAEYMYERRGEILRCPWHGWEFDIRTGQSWVDPAKTRVRAYDVEITPSQEGYVPGPYVAETYDVAVAGGGYIVVDIPGAAQVSL